jgi:hypothetical protein
MMVMVVVSVTLMMVVGVSLPSRTLSSLNASAILTAPKKGLVTLASKFCVTVPELWHTNQIVEYYFRRE